MTRKNKVKEKPYSHQKALQDLSIIEDCVDCGEYSEMIIHSNVGGSEHLLVKFSNAKEALYNLKKWLESRV